MERDNCRGCGELLDVEYLIVTECEDILCEACAGHHDCSICDSSEHESDSEYTPTATSCDESTGSCETDDQSSDEQ
jgi:hypothetical protein